MPLLMLDLDGTLIDRDDAFRAAAVAFLTGHGLPESDLSWVLTTDAGGYADREAMKRSLIERYGDSVPEEGVRQFIDHGVVDRVTLSEPVRDVLAKAIAVGWTCVVVTNGRTSQQRKKLRNTGLDEIVHGWAISEEVGHAKPDRQIFEAAAAAAGSSLQDAWMIGDSAQNDIGGAHGLQMQSIWISAGRPWNEKSFRPTHIADDVVGAINHVLGRPRRLA
ncbi:HAD family hydrolase [Nonomuraea sp. NPDC050404]|uniref:HAD family hydrolase n=1 Tax=Nonomuraea sp. NPDC050404 TaxID=3155783 RepID=UPI0033FD3B3E